VEAGAVTVLIAGSAVAAGLVAVWFHRQLPGEAARESETRLRL
jgi:hypothetical protein